MFITINHIDEYAGYECYRPGLKLTLSHYDYSHLYYDAVKYLSIAENEAYMAVFRDNPTRLRDLRLYLSKWNMFEYDAGVPRIELPYVNFRFSDSLTKMRSDGLSRAEMIDGRCERNQSFNDLYEGLKKID